MDIKNAASSTPEKIITKKINYSKAGPSEKEIEEIASILNLKDNLQKETKNLIKFCIKF